jgi:hypothetical protein
MLKFSAFALFLGSLAAALVLFVASPESLSREFFPGGAYAALAFEETGLDAETVLALERALGRPVVSEFSQWVFLNSFGSLEQVPLGEYEDRLETFDPRRDGYAVKLRNFFIRDGKRWVFIPLDRGIFGPLPVLNPERVLNRRIAHALEGVSGERPFSLVLKREDRPLGFHVLPFALAWPAAFLLAGAEPFPSLRRKAGRRPGPRARAQGAGISRRFLLLCAPPVFVVSLWGAPGCALAALFLYLAVLAAPPLREVWVRVLRGGQGSVRRFLAPYRFNVLVSLSLAPLFGLVIWAGRIPPVPGLLGLFALFALYFRCLGLRIRRLDPRGSSGPDRRDACRFVPLPILPPRAERPLISSPFALASCLAFLLNLPAGLLGLTSVPDPWPSLVSAQDYGDHVLYQTGFSRRPLRGDDFSAFADSGYFRYTVGEDGLVSGVLSGSPETGGAAGGAEIPPFPLADLSDFLALWAVPALAPWNSGGRTAVIPPFLVLVLALLPLDRARGKKIAACADKRIAA